MYITSWKIFWIISNDVSNKDIGFNSDYNEVTIHYKNRNVKKEKLSYKKKSGISDENTTNEWKSKNLEEIITRMQGWQLDTFKESYKHKLNNGISLFKKSLLEKK